MPNIQTKTVSTVTIFKQIPLIVIQNGDYSTIHIFEAFY